MWKSQLRRGTINCASQNSTFRIWWTQNMYMKCVLYRKMWISQYVHCATIRCTVTSVVKFTLRHICTYMTWKNIHSWGFRFVYFSRLISPFSRLKMPATKNFERQCTICRRKERNDRLLGPLIHTKTISGHFNCILYTPVMPDAGSIASNHEDDAIAGVKSRFIRDEGVRASKLVTIKCNSMLFHSYSFVRFAFLYILKGLQLL